MKFLIIALMMSHPLYSKDVTEYSCKIDNDMKADISLLDPKNPSVSLINKNSKFGLCTLKTLPMSKGFDKNAVNAEAIWYFKLEKCDFYSEKLKAKVNLNKTPSFKQSPAKAPGYLHLLNDQQPLFCTAKN